MLALVVGCAIPLSRLIASVYAGEKNFLTPVLGPVERGFYRLAGVDPAREQDWFAYTIAMIVFSVAGFLSLYALQRLQNFLPLNPRGFDAVPPDLAFNTSISFITNTNWQNYGGETTMSHLTQMLGLTVHNFLSAATGLAMAFALVRGFARSSATTVGNFWVDVTRVTLYRPAADLDRRRARLRRAGHAADACRRRRRDDARRREADDLDRTGGEPGDHQGARHQRRRLLQRQCRASVREPQRLDQSPRDLVAAADRRVASVLAFGRAVGDTRQGRAILATMAIFLIVGVGVVYWAETAGNPILTALGVDPSAGNLEGKEVRFGQAMSALYATATTGTSTGAVNTMHDSLTPLGGLVPMFNLLAGCIWPGGVGAGLYGFLVVAIIAVFVAGLMVGRTPEYLGKKIETREMKLAMFAVLHLSAERARLLRRLGAAADGARQPQQQRPARALGNHLRLRLDQRQQRLGLRRAQRQYALVQHDAGGLVMLLGRFAYVMPVLALAGGLAAKKKVPASAGTFPTDGPLFVGLLVGVIVILYLLQYFPALALGPVVEHFLMLSGKTF